MRSVYIKNTIILLLSLSFIPLFAQNDSINISKIDLQNNDDYSSFSIMDDDLNKYTVFFAGENHLFRKSNIQLEIKMLQYLYHKANVRYLLLEFGYSRGWVLDQYIQTGDSNYLNILKNYSYEIYADFYRQLYEFNTGLPENDKIHIIGIDVERFLGLPSKTLSLILPDTIPPKSIELSIESIKSIASYNDEYFKSKNDLGENRIYFEKNYSTQRTLELVLMDIKNNKADFINFLHPKDTSTFINIINSLYSYMIWDEFNDKNVVQSYVYREQYMFNQFHKIINKHPDQKFFAQFGRCHVPLSNQSKACNWYNYNSIAHRINNAPDKRIHQKVMSIGIFYPNEEAFSQNDLKELLPIFRKANTEGLSLIKVPNDSSYKKIRQKFHYLIINQNILEKDNSKEDELLQQYLLSKEEQKDKAPALNHIGFGIGIIYNQFDNINNSLISQGVDGFNNQNKHYHIALNFYQHKSGSLSLTHQWMSTKSKTVNNIEHQIKGSYNSMSFGYDFAPANNFHLVPALGGGYAFFKYTISNETAAGVIPEMRDACPRLRGLNLSNFSLISLESQLI